MTKILVVDDSQTVRIQLKRDLQEAGFLVVEASDGIEGLEQAKLESPDFILSDLNMPRLDGISMCRQIRQEPALATVPIFMLTTETSPEIKAKAKEVGIRAWIMKPYDPAKLIMGIKKVLNPAG